MTAANFAGIPAQEANKTETSNGMEAYRSSLNKNVDLFFKIGASRGVNVFPLFQQAHQENPETAMRIALWARDVRGGSGERQIFRDILLGLEKTDTQAAKSLMLKTQEVGRWDDLLIFQTAELKNFAFTLLKAALEAGNGLAAKWTPRKGKIAEEFRAFLGFSPKRYRKTLVTLTKVVETQMCAKDWDNINFGHVPSIAASRYKKAFARNASEAYGEYVTGLATGETTINAAAVFPYEVLRTALTTSVHGISATETAVMDAQWAALPNYLNGSKVLPMIDVSSSMTCKVGGGQAKLNCMDMAVSLGLYIADKNVGPFHNMFLTFDTNPILDFVKPGTIVDKVNQVKNAAWGGSTNLQKAFAEILRVAKGNAVPAEDMPEILIVFSDMQFNVADRTFSGTAVDMARKQYAAAGYTMPRIVFWNLNASDSTPAKANEDGVALVSGFSPAVMKAVLAGKQFTPFDIMIEAVYVDRYSLTGVSA